MCTCHYLTSFVTIVNYTCHNVSAIITILWFTLATMFQRLSQFCDLHLPQCFNDCHNSVIYICWFAAAIFFSPFLWFTPSTMLHYLPQFCDLHLPQCFNDCHNSVIYICCSYIARFSAFLWFTLYYWLSTWTVWNMPLYGCGCDHICQLQHSTYKGTLPVSRTHWLQTCPPWITPA